MSNDLAAPGSSRSSCSSKPGGLAFAPSSIGTSAWVSPAPDGSFRSRSTTAVSPWSTPRPSTGSNRAARSRRRCIERSTASSEIADEARRIEIVESSPGSNDGSVSNDAVKVSG